AVEEWSVGKTPVQHRWIAHAVQAGACGKAVEQARELEFGRRLSGRLDPAGRGVGREAEPPRRTEEIDARQIEFGEARKRALGAQRQAERQQAEALDV